MRTAWWLVPLALALATTGTAGERLALRLRMDSAAGGVRLVGAERGAFAPARTVVAAPGRTLHVVGRDAGGNVLFDFHVRDPRVFRGEAFDPGTGHIVTARTVMRPVASFDLRVPDAPALAAVTVRSDGAPRLSQPVSNGGTDSARTPAGGVARRGAGAGVQATFGANLIRARLHARASDAFFSTAGSNVRGMTYLRQSGPSSERLDLVLIGDGYTVSQMDQWHADAAQVAASLMADPLYAAHADEINLLRVDVVSNQSGVSSDITGEHRDTALLGVIGCFQIDRLLCVDDARTLDAVSQVTTPDQRDFILVVSNTDLYGGSGGVVEAAMTMNQYAAELALHELGHTMFGLADEYVDPGETCYDQGEPVQPNATRITSRDQVKWAPFIGAATSLPTPPGAYPQGTVGLFQGGDHCADVFRPTEDSRMRTLGEPWYAVNWQAGAEVFEHYAEPADGRVVARSRATEGTCRFVRQPDGEITCTCGN